MIILYTSNILQHKLPNDAHISTAMCHMLDHWIDDHNKVEKPSISSFDDEDVHFIPSFERKLLNSTADDVTIKIFLRLESDLNSINQYIDDILSVLDKHFLDVSKRIGLFIISIDGCSSHICRKSDVNYSFKDVMNVWIAAGTRILQTAPKLGISVEKFGTTELSAQELDSLIQETKLHHSTSLVPSTESIHSDVCCNIPEDLLEITNKNNIKLIPHRDPVLILPDDELRQVLNRAEIDDNHSWTWIARFTAINKERQVLTNMEFLIALK